ncbi:hypothetical protein Pyn_03016 [Prunus yedoensis var. nudiflora]|uniref:Uncharacterized protein n=1 Tax=Prunus yedoensis var. nudiflora TaxID=2094558 RepID=A0A314XJ42_PRUYE|nr:hypothetical protein Pyn_03016 [Prunus yedoensis var. nudiflora]
MWLGNQLSNWGTGLNSTHIRILNTRASVISPTHANYPAKGLRNTTSRVSGFRSYPSIYFHVSKYPYPLFPCISIQGERNSQQPCGQGRAVQPGDWAHQHTQQNSQDLCACNKSYASRLPRYGSTLDEGFVRLWNGLPEEKMGRDGGIGLEINVFQGREVMLALSGVGLDNG